VEYSKLSYFAFPKDSSGNVLVTDKELAGAVEALINQLILLNLRFEEAFDTKIEIEDVNHDN